MESQVLRAVEILEASRIPYLTLCEDFYGTNEASSLLGSGGASLENKAGFYFFFISGRLSAPLTIRVCEALAVARRGQTFHFPLSLLAVQTRGVFLIDHFELAASIR